MKQRVSLITLGTTDLDRARPLGHPWEVAHNPHWTATEDGGIRLN